MDLSKKSLKELKELAKDLGVQDYEKLSKAELIPLLEPGENIPEESLTLHSENVEVELRVVKVQLPEKEIVTVKLEDKEPKIIVPPQVRRAWLTYLKRYNLTAQEFLNRYPSHPEKETIKNL